MRSENCIATQAPSGWVQANLFHSAPLPSFMLGLLLALLPVQAQLAWARCGGHAGYHCGALFSSGGGVWFWHRWWYPWWPCSWSCEGGELSWVPSFRQLLSLPTLSVSVIGSTSKTCGDSMPYRATDCKQGDRGGGGRGAEGGRSAGREDCNTKMPTPCPCPNPKSQNVNSGVHLAPATTRAIG